MDEFVAGGFVGNAQQGFGQTHQGDAFFAGKGELVHQCIHPAGAAPLFAHLLHQPAGEPVGGGTLVLAHLGAFEHILHGFNFVTAVGIGNGLAQAGLLGVGKLEHGWSPWLVGLPDKPLFR